MATRERIKKGFSKLLKEEKLKLIANYFENPGVVISLLKSYWHPDSKQQQLFDEFSENTITNFFIPYGISPNVTINGKDYVVPMVIEESSVVAAASAAAKFWGERGGFHAEVIDVRKVGQVHFGWSGPKERLFGLFPAIRERLLKDTAAMTEKMVKRGGGILGMRLIDYSEQIPDYYQIRVEFGTGDAMGANFINSVLEQFGHSLQDFFAEQNDLPEDLRKVEIIMTILSNNTPDCRVKVWVECPIEQLDGIAPLQLDVEEEQFWLVPQNALQGTVVIVATVYHLHLLAEFLEFLQQGETGQALILHDNGFQWFHGFSFSSSNW